MLQLCVDKSRIHDRGVNRKPHVATPEELTLCILHPKVITHCTANLVDSPLICLAMVGELIVVARLRHKEKVGRPHPRIL